MNRKKRSPFSRRAFLCGAGTTGLALPFLEGLPERSAFAADDDPRFGFFICTANGIVGGAGSTEPDRFWPTTHGELTPGAMEMDSAERCTGLLAQHASRLLIVSGLTHAASPVGETSALGHVMCLTGLAPEGTSNTATSTGPSADWVIARAWGGEPLTLYAGAKLGYINEKLSFSAAGQVTAAEGNPYQVYLRLAGLLDEQSGQPTPVATELARRRLSIHDLVREEIASLEANPRLSQADRQRLELHLDSIRDIENEFPRAMICDDSRIDEGELAELGEDAFIEDVARMQIRLAGLAFSCDMTRAGTLQWGDGNDTTQYVIDGEVIDRFSFIANRRQSDGASGAPIPDAMEKHVEIDRIRMRTFEAGLDFWSELSTPRGSLFDSAFALFTNAKSDGPSDSFRNLPIIIAGSPGGYLKQGQYLQAAPEGSLVSMARLLSSLIEACAVDASGFADGAGGLESIEA